MGNIIERKKQQDLERTLFSGYFNTLLGHIQPAIENFKESLKIAKEREYKQEEADAYLWLGHAYQLNKEYRHATGCYGRALEIAKKQRYVHREVEANLKLGKAYALSNEDERAIKCYKAALYPWPYPKRAFERVSEIYLTNERQKAEACLGLGDAKTLPESLSYYEKALERSQGQKHKFLEAKAHLRLGRTYNQMKECQTAIPYFKTSLRIVSEQKYEEQKVKANFKLQNYYQDIKQFSNVFENLLDGQEAEAYLGLGNAYRLETQLEPAIQYYERVLEIDKKWKAKTRGTKIFNVKDAVHDMIKTSNEKVTYINTIFEAFKIVDKIDLNDIRVEACQHLVNIFTSSSEHFKPIKCYKKTYNTHFGMKADEMEVIAYQWLGYYHLKAGQYQQSIEYYNEVVKLVSQHGYYKRKINAYLGLGSASSNTNDFESSRKYLLKAVTLAEKLRAKDLQREAHTMLGHVYHKNHKFDTALESYLKAEDISRDLSDRKGEAHACLMLGTTFQQLKRHEEAIESYKKALDISQDLKDKEIQARALHGLGSSFFNIGQHEEALKYSKSFVELTDEPVNHGTKQVLAQKRLGMCYAYVGRFQEGLQRFKKALEMVRGSSEKAEEGIINEWCGYCCRFIEGQHEEAIQFYEEAKDIAQKLELKTQGYRSNQALGDILWTIGNYNKSKEYYQEAMKIGMEIGDQYYVGTGFLNLASVCRKERDYEMAIEWFEKADDGDYEKAKEYYQQAMKISMEFEDKYLEGTACLFLASICRKNADYLIAIRWYKQAYDASLKVEDQLLQEKALTGLGITCFDLGDAQQAIEWLRKAQKLNEEPDDEDFKDVDTTNAQVNLELLQELPFQAPELYEVSAIIFEQNAQEETAGQTS